MIGSIIGDIAGSRFEFDNHLSKDFKLFGPGVSYTDDTVMTVAVADWLCNTSRSASSLVRCLHEWGARYPHPMGGYGGSFSLWLTSGSVEPYNSFGNGAAMRVSPCGFFYGTPILAASMGGLSASVTHSHPEGIKGASAVAWVTAAARGGASKDMIRGAVAGFGYDITHLTCRSLRSEHRFDETCMGTVPAALVAFLESDGFEDAVRNAVSIGGDSDTIAAITGGIAGAFYGVPDNLREAALSMLPADMRQVIDEFEIMAKNNNSE